MNPEPPSKPPIPPVPVIPVVVTCSGAGDTGELADSAARSLARSGVVRMYCLAGVGARVEQIVSDMAEAERIVSVDGCDNDCSRKVLEAAGFQPAIHIRITDLGMPKGQTPMSEERVRQITDELRRRLKAERLQAREDGSAAG